MVSIKSALARCREMIRGLIRRHIVDSEPPDLAEPAGVTELKNGSGGDNTFSRRSRLREREAVVAAVGRSEPRA